ncbi:hypothetical protein NDN08_007030 [Rhodosorus marinus]|uniref:Tim44-like domain-containing protein n=1 Tax=Rhodosorus marinus TaxID=101924 RepID=A0AAV8UFC0_9RHOD|nr:hypothetical protein NDN08_007030 [Rhodosorus marinus]
MLRGGVLVGRRCLAEVRSGGSGLRLYRSSGQLLSAKVKEVAVRKDEEEEDELEREKKSAVGGFMRGLIGGREAAAEDEYVSEAKKAGIDVPPPPPPPRRKDLQVVKVKRKKGDDEEEHTIRDRLFSRFAGSTFLRGAMEARERISERIDESDNPVINFFRDMHARLFSETEMGSVLREIREKDEEFRIYDFIKEMEEDYIPKILSAYLSSDLEKLKELCTDEAVEVLTASIKEQQKEGIQMDPSILDIGEVELTTAKFLQDDPVLIISFSAQQINCVRNKAGDVIEGSENDIRAVYYVWALVREYDDDDEDQVPTGGSAEQDGDERSEKSEESVESAENGGEEKAKTKRKKTQKAESKDDDDKGNSHGDGEKKLPPWKMMEMVIRGAHLTI